MSSRPSSVSPPCMTAPLPSTSRCISTSTLRSPLLGHNATATGSGTDAPPRARHCTLSHLDPPVTILINGQDGGGLASPWLGSEKGTSRAYDNVTDDLDLYYNLASDKESRARRRWRNIRASFHSGSAAQRRRVWGVLLLVMGLGLVTISLGGGIGRAGIRMGVGAGWGLVDDVHGLLGGKAVPLGHWDVALGLGGAKGAGTEGKGPEDTSRVGEKGKKKGKAKWDKAKPKIDDGLLHFNPTDLVRSDAPHPITTLIEQAQATWVEKNARQSKTLKEAVGEYKRRYRRAPPKGFEKWWKYVKAHNVPLPDEYDQIANDIHSFHPHRPHVISAKHAAAAKLPDTYVLRNKGGILSVERNFELAKHSGGEQRLQDHMKMVKGVAGDIGDFEAVWSVHDTGRGFMSWSQRSDLQRAREGRHFLDEEENDEQTGWSALCPFSPDFASALYSTPSTADLSLDKSFITSHPLSYSICNHLSLIPIHGSTAGPYRSPKTTGHLPMFSYSRHALQSDILGIPYSHTINQPPTPWSKKTESRLLWRGSLTGAHYDAKVDWRRSQRFRLLDLHKAGPTSILTPTSDGSPDLTETTHALAAAQYLDVGATGKPIQCDAQTCALIAKEYAFVPRMTHQASAAYKYVLDVDGNAWSARFKGLLSTGSVVLKSTIMPEWWSDRAQAWVHYVPVKVDYGDVLDIMAYFTGDLTTSKANGNDTAGRAIAEAGQKWAATHWRDEDTTAYTFRLYLEWARVWSGGDRLSGYVYDEKDEV